MGNCCTQDPTFAISNQSRQNTEVNPNKNEDGKLIEDEKPVVTQPVVAPLSDEQANGNGFLSQFEFTIDSYLALSHAFLETFSPLEKMSGKQILDALKPGDKSTPKQFEAYSIRDVSRLLPLVGIWVITKWRRGVVSEDCKLPMLWLLHATSNYWEMEAKDIENSIKAHLANKSYTNDGIEKVFNRNRNSLFKENVDFVVDSSLNDSDDHDLEYHYEVVLNVGKDFIANDEMGNESNEIDDYKEGQMSWKNVSMPAILLTLISSIGLYISKRKISILGVTLSHDTNNCLTSYFSEKFSHKRSLQMAIKKLFRNAKFFNGAKMADGDFHHKNVRQHATSYSGNVNTLKKELKRLQAMKLQLQESEKNQINKYLEQIKINPSHLESKHNDSDSHKRVSNYLDTVQIDVTPKAKAQIENRSTWSLEICEKNIKNAFKYFYVCCCNSKILNSVYTRAIAGHDRPLQLNDFMGTSRILLSKCPYSDGISIDVIKDKLNTTSRMYYDPYSNNFYLIESKLRISVQFLKDTKAFRFNLVKDTQWENFTELLYGLVHEHGHVVPRFSLPAPRLSCTLYVIHIKNQTYYVQGGSVMPLLASGGQYGHSKGDYNYIYHELYKSTTFRKTKKIVYISEQECEQQGLNLIKNYEFPSYWDCKWAVKIAAVSFDSDGDAEPETSVSTNIPANLCGYGYEPY